MTRLCHANTRFVFAGEDGEQKRKRVKYRITAPPRTTHRIRLTPPSPNSVELVSECALGEHGNGRDLARVVFPILADLIACVETVKKNRMGIMCSGLKKQRTYVAKRELA